MTVETTAIEQISRLQAPPQRMSYEEWLAWEHEGGLTEWVNGEVIIFIPPLDEHQRIVEFLDRLMDLFVELFNLGMIRIAPFTMQAKPAGQGREPDLFFLASANMSRLTRKALIGPADLIVEVVSEDSIARDRVDKFYEYPEAGVREYWIIDPRPGKQRVDLYVLGADGRYQPVLATKENVYHSTVLPNFWLKEAWLLSERPKPLAALTEIVGVERVITALRETD